MSEISKEEIMEESVARLYKLNLNNEVIENFKNDILMVSDNGKLSSIEENPQINIIKKAINEVKKLHANPYHIILTKSNFGLLCDILYVSNYLGDWE